MGLPIIFKGKGLNEKIYIKGTKNPVLTINKEYFRPAEVDLLIGNPAKAKEILGWEPTTKFSELVTKMMKADLKRNGVNL